MPKLSVFTSVLDVGYGRDPILDAWLLHFMSENNLEYTIDPEKNASPEQVRFMVALGDDQFYAPCSDWMLLELLNGSLSPELRAEYIRKWRALVGLLRTQIHDRATRLRILNLCRHKFRLVLASPIIIPSRFMKRLVTMFLSLGGGADPCREERTAANARAFDAIKSGAIDRLINACPAMLPACASLDALRYELWSYEFSRLVVLSTRADMWNGAAPVPGTEVLEADFGRAVEAFQPLKDYFGQDENKGLRVLYLPESAGGLIFDLLAIRSLLRAGYKVVLALKAGFHFQAPAIWDWDHDPVLAGQLREAYILDDNAVSKNELLRYTRENDFLIISDGTREDLNLYRTSVTFARAWKEADVVLAKGVVHYRRLIQSSHEFTRDVFCFFRDDAGRFRLHYKPKPATLRKFSESSIAAMAQTLISSMRRAHTQGKSVMFYSAVIGSIPGQTKTALRILEAFVAHLRERLPGTFVINPGEHFVEGMDADDLMYMWEKVQRSGFIDVWRFQSVEDIEKGFELLGEKVPPFWAGKDATYSTGCTKEMAIALEEQKKHPEMQIIGPSPEKFFRRREYGVGKYCDAALDCR